MGRLWSAAAVMGKYTADLSTSLRSGRDDKGGAVMVRGSSHGETHRRSLTSMRSGRDDKGWGGYGPRQQSWGNTPQISPLRCAPVEMTKGGRLWSAAAVMGKHTADLSLRCAPVEMT